MLEKNLTYVMQKFLLNPMLHLKSNLNPIINLQFLLNTTKLQKFSLNLC